MEDTNNNSVLVIDDNEAICDALRDTLEFSGYKVKLDFTGDYLEEIMSCRQNNPGIVIMDIYLSGKDGRDLVRKMRGHDKTKNLPVIMISAHPAAGYSAIKAGANDFLAKPFNIVDLQNKVAKYL